MAWQELFKRQYLDAGGLSGSQVFCVVVERRFRDSWRLSTVGLRWMFQSVCGSGQSSGVAVTGLVRVEQASNELDVAHLYKYRYVDVQMG